MTPPPISSLPSAFRAVPRTGVIYVMTEATRRGYHANHPDWANLGQGAPETGALPRAPDRVGEVHIDVDEHEYAPVDGLVELRDAVAALYNARYRQGKASQYTRDNVAISPGGRAALTRLVATLGRTKVGHLLPDYTAYEELLGSFGTFDTIPIPVPPDRAHGLSEGELRDEILDRGLGAVLFSNPCNPTGRVLHGERLRAWVGTARDIGCTLLVDEFYSHYVYVGDQPTVSAAQMVEDVNEDPVVIVDGLTKNWRYPGWRVCWTIGPKSVIDGVCSAGSFLDGGCARPMQKAAIPLVAREIADAEAQAIQRHFRGKRQRLLEGLEALGIQVHVAPQGGFYVWGDLSRLPAPLNTGMGLFRAALDHGVILVPGEFFDINPGQRRPNRPGRYASFARFSFGPSEEVLSRGLEGLRRTIYG
ncbi:MAG: hypothetical protein RLZZ383_2013 [Pseudomonadota bacterium]